MQGYHRNRHGEEYAKHKEIRQNKKQAISVFKVFISSVHIVE